VREKGFTQIILIGALTAIIALVVIGFFLYQRGQLGPFKISPKASPTPSPTQTSPQESLDLAPCDINEDGKCNVVDLDLLNKAMGTHRGQKDYIPLADLDADGVINDNDKQMLLKLLDQNQNDETANWKTYKSKDNLYQISYPADWFLNDANGVSMGRNQIDLSITILGNGTKKFVEEQWNSTPCGPGDPNLGCTYLANIEMKKFSSNENTVYWKIDGNNQIHAYIPNEKKNKTVEIYSVYLKDKSLFQQILSTFKFLD